MGSVVDAISGAVSFISDAISDTVSSVTSALWDAISSVSSTLSNIILSITSQISSIASLPVEGIKSVSSLIWVKITSVLSRIIDLFHTYHEWFHDHPSAGLNYLSRFFDGVIRAILAYTTHNVNLLWDTLNAFISSIGGKIASIYAWVRNKIGAVWDWVKNNIVAVYEWVRDKIGAVWSWVKSKVDEIYGWVKDNISVVYTWVKDKISLVWKQIHDWLNPILNWLKAKLKEVYDFYMKKLHPIFSKIVDTIHKVAVISEVYRSIREGKILRAFLQGIAIADKKLADIVRNIAKGWDKTVKSLAKLFGFSVGYISKIITDVQINLNRIIEDTQRIVKNTNFTFLKRVENILMFMHGNIVSKIRNMLTSQNSILRSIVNVLTSDAVEMIRIIQETYRDYHRYDYLVRASELRKFDALTARPLFPLLLDVRFIK